MLLSSGPVEAVRPLLVKVRFGSVVGSAVDCVVGCVVAWELNLILPVTALPLLVQGRTTLRLGCQS